MIEEVRMDKYMDQRTGFVVLHICECQVTVNYKRSPGIGSNESVGVCE